MRTFYDTLNSIIWASILAAIAYAAYAMFSSGHVTVGMIINGASSLLHAAGL